METLAAGCWGPRAFTPPGPRGGSPQAQQGRARAPSHLALPQTASMFDCAVFEKGMERAIRANIAFRRMFMFMEGDVRNRGLALVSRVLHLVVGIRPRHSVLSCLPSKRWRPQARTNRLRDCDPGPANPS